MEPKNHSGERDVVQWVIPRSKRLKQDANRAPDKSAPIDVKIRSSSSQANASSPTDSDISLNFNKNPPNSLNNDEQDGFQVLTPDQLKIDFPLCKTICIFVEEHLKDLQEHQQSIERARLDYNIHIGRDLNDRSNLARVDALKIRVRDEQTKAIETIKQLTNYLRELTTMKNHYDCAPKQIHEDIANKLTDVRLDIIQALNDFVISNSDIDVPITDQTEEFNYQEYDLCTDVMKDSTAQSMNTTQQLSGNLNCYPSMSESTSIISSDNHDSVLLLEQSRMDLSSDNQINMLEKRRRDMQKLCKDTVELRRLFSDFYNLIQIQGEQVDKIEDNIVITAQRISEGQHNLNKSVRNLTLLVPVTGCITGALIGGPIGLAVGSKLGAVSIVCAASLFGLISSYSAQKCMTLKKIKDC